MKEKCVLCGALTTIDETTDISLRSNYIEGAGQLCNECAHRLDLPERIIATKKPQKKPNIIQWLIMAIYLLVLFLLVCMQGDGAIWWLKVAGLTIWGLLGWIIGRNSNFNLNNNA